MNVFGQLLEAMYAFALVFLPLIGRARILTGNEGHRVSAPCGGSKHEVPPAPAELRPEVRHRRRQLSIHQERSVRIVSGNPGDFGAELVDRPFGEALETGEGREALVRAR